MRSIKIFILPSHDVIEDANKNVLANYALHNSAEI